MKSAIWVLLAAASLCRAANLEGDWIAEISAKGADPQYARVKLSVNGSSIGGTSLSGTWNHLVVKGSASGDRIQLTIERG